MAGSHLSAKELLRFSAGHITELPQRGGAKDYSPDSSWLQAKRVQLFNQERKEVLSEDRVKKKGHLTRGEWRSDLGKVEVVGKKSKFLMTSGHGEMGRFFLNPEEALVLLEKGDLEVYYGGMPLSVQEAYSTLLLGRVPLEHFQVYSHLVRLGYIVFRHTAIAPLTPYERKLGLTGRVPQEGMGGRKRKWRAAATEETLAPESKLQHVQGPGDHSPRSHSDITASAEISVQPESGDRVSRSDITASAEISVQPESGHRVSHSDITASAEISVQPESGDRVSHSDITASAEISVQPESGDRVSRETNDSLSKCELDTNNVKCSDIPMKGEVSSEATGPDVTGSDTDISGVTVGESRCTHAGHDLNSDLPCNTDIEQLHDWQTVLKSSATRVRSRMHSDFSAINFPNYLKDEYSEHRVELDQCSLPPGITLLSPFPSSEHRFKPTISAPQQSVDKDFSFEKHPENRIIKASNWTEYKKQKLDISEEEFLLSGPAGHLWSGDVQPLIKPSQAKSTASLLEKMKIISNINFTEDVKHFSHYDSSHDLVYDVHSPDCSFSKNDPGKPAFRLCIAKQQDKAPQLADFIHTVAHSSDGVPLQWAVVDGGDVTFYAFHGIDLPRDISPY